MRSPVRRRGEPAVGLLGLIWGYHCTSITLSYTKPPQQIGRICWLAIMVLNRPSKLPQVRLVTFFKVEVVGWTMFHINDFLYGLFILVFWCSEYDNNTSDSWSLKVLCCLAWCNTFVLFRNNGKLTSAVSQTLFKFGVLAVAGRLIFTTRHFGWKSTTIWSPGSICKTYLAPKILKGMVRKKKIEKVVGELLDEIVLALVSSSSSALFPNLTLFLYYATHPVFSPENMTSLDMGKQWGKGRRVREVDWCYWETANSSSRRKFSQRPQKNVTQNV